MGEAVSALAEPDHCRDVGGLRRRGHRVLVRHDFLHRVDRDLRDLVLDHPYRPRRVDHDHRGLLRDRRGLVLGHRVHDRHRDHHGLVLGHRVHDRHHGHHGRACRPIAS